MDTTAEAFEEVWEKFVSGRQLEYGGHTDPKWRGEHDSSASFIVPVNSARFDERLEPLRSALRAFPFVSLHPDHFMHISLVFAGFPVENGTPGADGAVRAGRASKMKGSEISRDRLEEIETRAREALRNFESFPVRLANLNAFPAAAFIEAHDSGEIYELREILGKGCDLKVKSGPPHLTLAYFHAPDGSRAPDELIREISSYRDWPVGEIEVREVELSMLDLTAPYPEPRVVSRIPLK